MAYVFRKEINEYIVRLEGTHPCEDRGYMEINHEDSYIWLPQISSSFSFLLQRGENMSTRGQSGSFSPGLDDCGKITQVCSYFSLCLPSTLPPPFSPPPSRSCVCVWQSYLLYVQWICMRTPMVFQNNNPRNLSIEYNTLF